MNEIDNNDKAHRTRIHEWITSYRTLSDLILGILIFCVICQIGLLVCCILFWGKALYYSIGLWLGGLVAIFLAWHMNRSISIAVDFDSATATKLMRKGTYIRYLAIIIILAGFMLIDIVSPLTVFLGIMGLKAGAYSQPFVHKLLNPIVGEEPINDCPLIEEVLDDEASNDSSNNNSSNNNSSNNEEA